VYAFSKDDAGSSPNILSILKYFGPGNYYLLLSIILLFIE